MLQNSNIVIVIAIGNCMVKNIFIFFHEKYHWHQKPGIWLNLFWIHFHIIDIILPQYVLNNSHQYNIRILTWI